MNQYRAIGSGEPQWNSKLLQDLAFIKKNLRYPYGKVMFISSLVFVLLVCVVVFKLLTVHVEDYMPIVATVAVIALIMLIPALQYVVALRFKAIETRYTAEGNTALLDAFFAAQGLVVFRHPEADGVFQLESKPMLFRQGSTREIILFIADDKRILINNHYSDFNFGHSVEARQMQRRLKEWLNRGYANNNYSIR